MNFSLCGLSENFRLETDAISLCPSLFHQRLLPRRPEATSFARDGALENHHARTLSGGPLASACALAVTSRGRWPASCGTLQRVRVHRGDRVRDALDASVLAIITPRA